MAYSMHKCKLSLRLNLSKDDGHKRRSGERIPLASLISFTLLLLVVTSNAEPECLTGNFTNIQNWVLEDGSLSPYINSSHALDLSGQPDALSQLRVLMSRNAESTEPFITWNVNSFMEFNYNVYGEDYMSGRSDNYTGGILLKNVYFLSLARNSLDRIPLFYTDSNGVSGSNWRHLKYLSLYGNDFYGDSSKISQNQVLYSITLNASSWEEVNPRHYFSYAKGRSNWASDLARLDFTNLLELDLRNCSIQVLYDETFVSLPNLRRLYLSDNMIYQIYSSTFNGLSNLIHLDISRNTINVFDNDTGLTEGMTLLKDTFVPLVRLKSLDFSYTRIIQTCYRVFEELPTSVKRLSLCYTRFPVIVKGMFSKTSLEHLDISGNIALEQINQEAFDGIENTLKILYAKHLAIKNLRPFQNLKQLNVLNLARNDISAVEAYNLQNMTELRILDLSDNRITNWNKHVLHDLKRLELLKLNQNNLNLLSLRMIEDFKQLKFLSLASNSFVCNCYVRMFIENVMHNNQLFNLEKYPDWFTNETAEERFEFPDVNDNELYVNLSERINYHNAYIYYSRLIYNRNTNYSYQRTPDNDFDNNYDYWDEWFSDSMGEVENAFNFSFLLLDYSEQDYLCMDSKSNTFRQFRNVSECGETEMDHNIPGINSSSLMVIFLIVLAFIIVIGLLIVWKWWYVRYFFLMMKNMAILSILGKDNDIDDCDKVFTYDVFVSYCDDDRAWVIDELLPHVEDHGAISVCLHERDFQIGLSILENIISCMDRSRALLMVVSTQFLLSQWCQFEMHLAQHRLLETRREQLILVLLEDIPRRKRPNTLHYLMMTKTYIVWPKLASERPAFWKRLNRSILHGKTFSEKYSVA